MDKQDNVVLVHGLGGSRLDMWPIARRLRRIGYRVTNWGYTSFGHRIEEHATRLARDLLNIDVKAESKFHLVTHSMGGIIVRTIFSSWQFENLGRVVMLAPPHRGSHMARKLSRCLNWLAPSLKQLSDEPDSFVNELENSLARRGIEFGIVEAAKDRVIERGGVMLDGHSDIASVNGHHGVLTWYPQTIRLVENFLRYGTFSERECQMTVERSPAIFRKVM